MITRAALVFALLACSPPSKDAGSRAATALAAGADTAVTAITGVTLIDGRGGAPIGNATILVRDSRIIAIGPTRDIPVPAGATRLDLPGHVVIPGLVDVHFHVTTAAMRYRRSASGGLDSTYDRALAERLLRTALAFGITTVRDPGASPMDRAIALRDDVAGGRIAGPRVFTAGPIINNPRLTHEQIRAAVRQQAAASVSYIKVYSSLDSSQVHAAIQEAHRNRLRVIGHLQRTSWIAAARAGIDVLTHGSNWHGDFVRPERRAEYRSLGGTMRSRIAWLEWLDMHGPAVDTLVRLLAERRVSVDPTLVAYHTKFFWRDSIYQRDPDVAVVPEELQNWNAIGMHTADWSAAEFDRARAAWPNQLALVRRMHEGGVLLTAGSDVASPWVIPGVGLHQELVLLASAGISPLKVISIATRNGARALGVEAETGTLERGKRADLVILTANPLRHLRNTRSIRYVMLGGMLHEPATLLSPRATR
jgi:imidazolonepropionase-like amidohydrolase